MRKNVGRSRKKENDQFREPREGHDQLWQILAKSFGAFDGDHDARRRVASESATAVRKLLETVQEPVQVVVPALIPSGATGPVLASGRPRDAPVGERVEDGVVEDARCEAGHCVDERRGCVVVEGRERVGDGGGGEAVRARVGDVDEIGRGKSEEGGKG